MSPIPSRSPAFHVLGWRLSAAPNAVTFDFRCDRHGSFSEIITLPELETPLHTYAEGEGRPVLDLLGIALGVSYYKIGAAERVILPPVPPSGHAMAVALYTEGLAEFYVRAGLPYPADITIEGDILPAPAHTAPTECAAPRALVAFGGGKDSYVARDIVTRAGTPSKLGCVVLSDAVRDVLTATAPETPIFLRRQLDPGLIKASKNGFNGHVPITAINMLSMALFARLAGFTEVIFANERSADEPTMSVDGHAANHQYSKSGAFEELLQSALHDADPSAPSVFSILRPYSELWIGRAFASLKDPFGRFTSCNRNFRLAGDATTRWCGECPKCAFTSLILAPFLSADEGQMAFGENFLDREALLPFYTELCGLTEQKPWECVGTIAECQAALWAAAQHPHMSNTLAVKTLLPQLIERVGEEALTRQAKESLASTAAPFVPPRYIKAAEGIAP